MRSSFRDSGLSPCLVRRLAQGAGTFALVFLGPGAVAFFAYAAVRFLVASGTPSTEAAVKVATAALLLSLGGLVLLLAVVARPPGLPKPLRQLRKKAPGT